MRVHAKMYRCVFLIVFSAVFASNKAYSGTVADWDFNETLSSQTYYDSTSNNNHLIRGSSGGSDSSDPAFSSDTPHHTSSGDYSIDFDGINDYAYRTNTASLKPTGEFTLSTWVKIDSLDFGAAGSYDAQDIMISNFGAYGSGGGYQLLFANAVNPQVVVMYRNGSYQDRGLSYSLSSLGFQTDTWYHITGTYVESGSNALLKLYVDGKLMAQDTLSGQISYDNTPAFFLGTNYDMSTNERYLDGHMDETMVFNDAKSDTAVRSLAEIDIDWAGAVSDVASNKSRWFVEKIPGYASNVTLPDYGTPYTVTLNENWEINDLDIKANAKAYLGNCILTVNKGGNIRGTLELAGATYNANQNVGMSSTGLIVGYGIINREIASNTGVIKAQGSGQQLTISLTGNDSEGTLIADQGATLYISNASNITNRDTITLTGGTLKGHASKFILSNSSSSQVISGYGTIENYYVDVGTGTLTASGSGKTLTLNEGFSGGTSSGTINVQSGATLNVLQPWTNYSAVINMAGGSITGSLMSQNNGISGSGLQALSGTNSIQTISFSSGSVNVIANNATLKITQTATLNNATITKGGSAGNFNVDTNATVQGYGTINPDMVNNGYLIANSSGKTLTLNGTLGVASTRSAYATNGATLTMTNTVNNQGYIYANTGSFVNINNSLTNTANVYANGGTLNIGSAIYNRSNIFANTGSVNITGTIKAGVAETGDFYVNNGNMDISSGAIETGARNTFTAYSGGSITLPANFSTATLYNTEGIKPQGGTITLNSGQTLTNVAGKTIKGYGTLLSSGRYLNNYGIIEGYAGVLDVYGNIRNDSIMSAGELSKLTIHELLRITNTGVVSAANGGEININGKLEHEGLISSSGDTSLVFIDDIQPTGAGRFIAEKGGKILFNDGFTNKTLDNKNSLQIAGGIIAVKNSTMTNETGHVISGHGSLLDKDDTLINKGDVCSSGGLLAINGTVLNQGNIYAEQSDSLNINVLNNSSGKLRSIDGASISIKDSINDGLIEIKNGGGSGTIDFFSSTGSGVYSLENGKMAFRKNLTLETSSYILDNNTDSTIEIHGDLFVESGADSLFDADNIFINLYSPVVAVQQPVQQQVGWHAQDMGLDINGLISNMAIGFIMFGDGVGDPESNLFWFHAESIIYCFGLNIQSDAEIDLNGATIYYLKSGDVVNGIVGTGFAQSGSYHNGNIYEISTAPIPEPGAVFLFMIGLGIFLGKKSRKV
ncbi:MAG: LamG-like jellyroll fold domain-containing protein [Candidatus Auribacterota bacterium]|jgi:hypothetical protein|nr:LamG-like jellyroll fold domain-containing protein [Candidatus Auribacterota bacterium]